MYFLIPFPPLDLVFDFLLELDEFPLLQLLVRFAAVVVGGEVVEGEQGISEGI